MKQVLTIAGFDPSSGAGVTADLAVFAAEGLFGASCISALTVQSTQGVRATHPVEGRIVRATLDCLEEDIPVDGVKVGMLATEENVRVVAEWLFAIRKVRPEVVVVLDPVVRSTSGRELLSEAGVAAMQEVLLGKVDWVTPNRMELTLLSGHTGGTQEDIEAAGLALQRRYPGLGVVATGGHFAGEDSGLVQDCVLVPGQPPVWLTGERVQSRATHGTGCAYSSALLCGLVSAANAVEAAAAAQRFVAAAIRAARPIGKGHGPMELSWKFR